MKNIKNQNYYNRGLVEAIVIIESVTNGYDGHSAFLVGNILKYLIRAPFKGNMKQDLFKGLEYYNLLIEHLYKEPPAPANIVEHANDNERW